MKIMRGEIYWADLNPAIGSEISKIRPVVVVSNNLNNEFSSTITILPITSKTPKVYPFEVLLDTEESHLHSVSKIKANQIRTIDKRRIKQRIGTVSDSKLKEIEKAILIHLDIGS
jgi:mRNA interferase MazF